MRIHDRERLELPGDLRFLSQGVHARQEMMRLQRRTADQTRAQNAASLR
jgi:hypothetical protein